MSLEESQQQKQESNRQQPKLGRGLGRLIPVQKAVLSAPSPSHLTVEAERAAADQKTHAETDMDAAIVHSTNQAAGRRVDQIRLSSIVPNARQPRLDFDQHAIEELASSIRSAGLIQPVIVRPIVGAPGRYELIAGERRWRACKSLGWTEISAIITNATDQDSGVWALIENVHRTDLNPMDRAAAIQKLVSEFRMTHDALAEQLGLERSTVTNLLRLSELDPATADLVRKGHLSQGHATVLLGVSNQKTRAPVAESAVRGDWSVRALEREVQRLAEGDVGVPRGTVASRRRSNIEALERKLSQAIGSEVKIQTGKKPNSGKLQIAFYSLEQFEGIVSRMGVKPSSLSGDEIF